MKDLQVSPMNFASENSVIRELIDELDVHEPGEAGHSDRVSVYAAAVGHELGLEFEDLLHLRRAAALHDIGKISVDQNLLSKLGRLTDEEIAELREHATLAMEILGSHDWLRPCVPMIRHHHEHLDGSGYPDGLHGEDIPLGARIISVCEAFDVLVHGCPWKEAVTEEFALNELRRCSGTQFDPGVVQALKSVRLLIQPVTR